MVSQEELSSEDGEGLEEDCLFKNLGSGQSQATWTKGAATMCTWTRVASAWEAEAQVGEVAISTQSSNNYSFNQGSVWWHKSLDWETCAIQGSCHLLLCFQKVEHKF